MRGVRLLILAGIALSFPRLASAQPEPRPLSQIEIAVACAPPTTLEMPDGRVLHIIGAQAAKRRSLYGKDELLVIDGGTSAGVQLNQQYFVRRPIYFGTGRRHPQSVATLGWVRVVAANETTAIVSVVHMCNGLAEGDFLEPFAAPSVPADLIRTDSKGDPDFTMLGRVVVGPENRGLGGVSSLMLIDRGADQGSTSGARFAVYRDLKTPGMPLSSIGEAVVVSVGKTMSLAWITTSRDAVVPGDYVVPRK
jgi:hypothetical protein